MTKAVLFLVLIPVVARADITQFKATGGIPPNSPAAMQAYEAAVKAEGLQLAQPLVPVVGVLWVTPTPIQAPPPTPCGGL